MKPYEQLPGFECRLTAWLVHARHTCSYEVKRIEGDEGIRGLVQFLHHFDGNGPPAQGVVTLALLMIPRELQRQGRFKRIIQMCCLLGGEAVVLRFSDDRPQLLFDWLERWGFVQVAKHEWGYFKANGGPWPLGTTTDWQGRVVYPPPKDWRRPQRKRRGVRHDDE